MKYVYEFSNKRKITKSEFLRWFQKKVLYTIRKFKMIKKNDIIGYYKKNDFRSVVLEDVLSTLSEKSPIKIVKLPKKTTKIALAETMDTISREIVKEIFKGDFNKLKKFPIRKNIINPLYLFLDKEVLLYVELKGLKFKKPNEKLDKVNKFIQELEIKHPEIKHSIINSYLEIFN